MTIFEVKLNRKGKWYYRSLAGGNILARSQAYASKSNAKRAAQARVKKEPGSRWRFWSVNPTDADDAEFR